MPGTYKFHFGTHKFVGAEYLNSTAGQSVKRDVTHDGTFTNSDIWHTETGDTVIETGDFKIYIHQGGATNTWSAGC